MSIYWFSCVAQAAGVAVDSAGDLFIADEWDNVSAR